MFWWNGHAFIQKGTNSTTLLESTVCRLVRLSDAIRSKIIEV